MRFTILTPAFFALCISADLPKIGEHPKGLKCCQVWSAFQKQCIETSKNPNQRGCENDRVDGKLGHDPLLPPEGEWACPEDCAVWRIQSKKCLVPKEGYPGDYIDDDGRLVHGGQMS